MAWFDGTFTYSDEELEKEFPVCVTNDLRMSADKTKLAIINNFPKNSDLLAASDPHSESHVINGVMFYHPFFGQDASTAAETVNGFLAAGYDKEPESVALFRREPQRLYMYGYGHICQKTFTALKEVFCDKERPKNPFFVLPLKRYLYNCPICGNRTLSYKDYYEICTECGWEDEPFKDEDEVNGANGEHSARTYREEYLRKKAENPGYSWHEEILFELEGRQK